jgi:hypothetical protein
MPIRRFRVQVHCPQDHPQLLVSLSLLAQFLVMIAYLSLLAQLLVSLSLLAQFLVMIAYLSLLAQLLVSLRLLRRHLLLR